MRREFLHYFILLLIIFSFCGILTSLKKYCPKKLKNYVLIASVLGMVSFGVQFYMSLAVTQGYINYLKPLVFVSNLVDIFLILISLYIFLRKEGLEFKWAYLYMFLMSISFVIAMVFIKSIVKVDKIYGYKIILVNDFLYRMVFIAILVILSVVMIIYMGYRYTLKVPFILLLFSTLIMIIENVAYMAEISIFPYPLISELMIVILFLYAMYRSRKIN